MFLFLEEKMMKKIKILNFAFIRCVSVVLLLCCVEVRVAAQEVNGRYSVNYPSGQVKERGFYKLGAKHKTWYYYSEAGHMDRKEKWQNGVLEWAVYYTAKGKVSKTIDRKGKVTTPAPCNCQ